MRQHTKSERPLPTLLQLHDLLSALKPKLADSGFENNVAGCYDWCSSGLNLEPSSDCVQIDVVHTPDTSGVQHLLDALNRCFRLGEESCTVRVDSWKGFLPWVIAVTRWMLGEFPNVWLLGGLHFIKSSLSKISVFEAAYGTKQNETTLDWPTAPDIAPDICFKVSLSRRLDSLDQLISTNETSRGGTAGGMLDAQLWTKLQMAKLGLPKSLCAQMLYFAAKYLAPKVVFRQTMENVIQKAQNVDTEISLPSAFPDQDYRLAAMQHLLGDDVVLPNEDPDFRNLNHDMKQICACKKCITDDKSTAFPHSIMICLEVRLGELAADLLSLTLFATEDQNHQFPMLNYVPWLDRNPSLAGIEVINGVIGRAQCWEELILHGWRPIMMQELQFLSCNSHAIFEHALNLMGQTFDSETILSSVNGQVIYPSILERGPFCGSAYLHLKCTRGCLIWDGSILEALVSSKGPSEFETSERPTPDATRVEYSPTRRRVQNKTFSLTLNELQRKGLLYSFTTMVYISIGDPAFWGPGSHVNVWDLIDGVSQAIFSPVCDHRQDSRAGAIGENFLFLEREKCFGSYELGDQSLLIDDDGDAMFQMLRLAVARECCILYRDGCISCALALAKLLDVKMVIC